MVKAFFLFVILTTKMISDAVDNHQASSQFHSFLESQQLGRTDTGFSDPFPVSHSSTLVV